MSHQRATNIPTNTHHVDGTCAKRRGLGEKGGEGESEAGRATQASSSGARARYGGRHQHPPPLPRPPPALHAQEQAGHWGAAVCAEHRTREQLGTGWSGGWEVGGCGPHTQVGGRRERPPPAHCAEATFTAQPPARVKGTQYRAVGAVCAHRGTHAPPAPPPGKRTRQPRRGHTVQRWRGSAASAGLRCVCTDRSNALFTEREGRGWNHCSFCCRS